MRDACACLLLAGLLGGCAPEGGASAGVGAGEVEAGGEREVVMSDDEVLGLFRGVWTGTVLPARPEARDFDGLVQSPRVAPSVSEVGFRTLRGEISASLGSPPPDDLLLFGSLQELDRDGSGRLVHFDGLLEPGLSACIDPASRRVILIWITPEG